MDACHKEIGGGIGPNTERAELITLMAMWARTLEGRAGVCGHPSSHVDHSDVAEAADRLKAIVTMIERNCRGSEREGAMPSDLTLLGANLPGEAN